ncbi:hypothetical protein EV284_6416 [Streptomyces sp. BK022]|uniref:hypothetical protein n=1 Tax=Streptomyces sp. BK022 TaxID=2512123 RepID=UPI0010299996|nr:hypothetical protein [Streptomyces sp. BK022]RZU28250.1 hypothetical protein EV284_6416 [Streptomyces sp. BK022]
MTTAPDADADGAPFDPHAFPSDLRKAQRKVDDLFARLHALQSTLPWSREPHPGWPAVDERARKHPGRPATPGWTAEQAAEYDGLRAELRDAAEAVRGHEWWRECWRAGVRDAALVDARQALKHAPSPEDA